MLITLSIAAILLVALCGVGGRALSGLYRELLASERAAADARQIAATCAAADAELRRQVAHWRSAAERTKRAHAEAYAALGVTQDALRAMKEKADG